MQKIEAVPDSKVRLLLAKLVHKFHYLKFLKSELALFFLNKLSTCLPLNLNKSCKSSFCVRTLYSLAMNVDRKHFFVSLVVSTVDTN